MSSKWTKTFAHPAKMEILKNSSQSRHLLKVEIDNLTKIDNFTNSDNTSCSKAFSTVFVDGTTDENMFMLWFNFYFPLFSYMVMCDNEYKTRKNKIEPRIK